METITNQLQNTVKELFLTELQKIISLLNCIYISNIINKKEIPNGFCSRVEKTFTNPVLGGLFELLIWFATKNKDTNLMKLTTYLLDEEKNGKGWISTFIQLRNKYQHPKEESPNEIINKAGQLLPSMFRFEHYGTFIIKEKVYWENGEEKICVYPFIVNKQNELIYLKEVKNHSDFIYSSGSDPTNGDINKIWDELRIFDNELLNPSSNEIIIKSRRKFTPFKNDIYWWFDKLFNEKANCYLIEKNIGNNLLSQIYKEDKKAVIVTAELNEYDIMTEICLQVGINPVNNIKDFIETFRNNKLFILINADKLRTREFLRLISWLNDVIKTSSELRIIVFIEREQISLENENERLIDHFQDFNNLFQKPPYSKTNDLTSFIWRKDLKKKVLRFL